MAEASLSADKAKPESGGRTSPDGRAAARRAQPAAPLLGLQQTVGNRALGRFLGSGGAARAVIQPSLRVGEPGDAFEREADRVADAVTGMAAPRRAPSISQVPAGGGVRRCARCDGQIRDEGDEPPATGEATVQRQCSCREEDTEEEGNLAQGRLAGAPGRAPRVGAEVAAEVAGLRGGGAPLPPALRSYFEPRFGQDFAAVRLHTGGAAERSAAALEARAFTVGHDVVFGAGEYAPESAAGRHLLAHELTHVVQQTPLVARREPLVQRAAAAEGEAAADPAAADSSPAAEPAPGDPGADPAADPGAAAAAPAAAPAAAAGAWIVDDAAASVGAGQMKKSEFLARLRPAVEAAAQAGPGAAGAAPLIESSFAEYQQQDAARLNGDLAELAPPGGVDRRRGLHPAHRRPRHGGGGRPGRSRRERRPALRGLARHLARGEPAGGARRPAP